MHESTHLLEPNYVRMAKRSVVDNFSRHILINLPPNKQNKLVIRSNAHALNKILQFSRSSQKWKGGFSVHRDIQSIYSPLFTFAVPSTCLIVRLQIYNNRMQQIHVKTYLCYRKWTHMTDTLSPLSMYFMATSSLVSLSRISLATPKFPDPMSFTSSYFSISTVPFLSPLVMF